MPSNTNSWLEQMEQKNPASKETIMPRQTDPATEEAFESTNWNNIFNHNQIETDR